MSLKENKNHSQFLPKDENNEELPPDETLHSELKSSDDLYASSSELGEEEEHEDVTEPRKLWHEAKHLEIEKPESVVELETPPEQVGEPDITDDPVRIYLHEIGRVHLLTAADEKTLAKKMEEGKRINEIRQQYLQEYGRAPSTTDVILTMLKEVEQASPIIHLLQEYLGLTPTTNFIESISDAQLRDSMNNTIDQQLIH